MRLALAVVFVVLARPLGADIVVPDDEPTLTAAIAAAQAGETILVRTAADQGAEGLITIDKPLTIIGDPICNVKVGVITGGQGAIRLAGPGSGAVVLVNVSVGYFSPQNEGRPLVFGGGFDSIELLGCSIRHDNLAPSGLITSVHPALDLPTLAEVVVVASDLLGGPAGADDCVPATLFQDGEPAISAPLASVLVLDSTLAGGRGGTFESTPSPTCALAAWGGTGGDGIVARDVHAWNSTILGGDGATWSTYTSGVCEQGTPTPCGTQPDGQPIVASGVVVEGRSRLTQSSARIELGGTWSLAWDGVTAGLAPDLTGCTGSCRVALYMAFAAPVAPYQLGADYAYLDPSRAFLRFVFLPTVQGQHTFTIPLAPSLVGLPVTSQALLGTGRLSGPTFALLVP